MPRFPVVAPAQEVSSALPSKETKTSAIFRSKTSAIFRSKTSAIFKSKRERCKAASYGLLGGALTAEGGEERLLHFFLMPGAAVPQYRRH